MEKRETQCLYPLGNRPSFMAEMAQSLGKQCCTAQAEFSFNQHYIFFYFIYSQTGNSKENLNPSLQIVQQKETKGQQRIAADMGILKRKFILNKHYPFFLSAFRPGKRVVQNLTQNPHLKDSCYFLTYPTQNQATRFSCSEMSATLKPVAKVQLTSRVPGLTQSVW